MAFLNFTRKREELPSDIDLDMPPEPPKMMREDTSMEEPVDEELMLTKKAGPEEEELPELPPLPDIEEPGEWGKGLDVPLPLPYEKKKKGERTIGKSPVLYIIIFVLVAGIAYSILNYKPYYAKAWNFILELFTRFPFLNEARIYLSSNYLTVLGAVLLIIILVPIFLVVRSAKKKGGAAQKRGEGLPELPPLPEEVPEMPEIPEEGAEFPEIPPVPEEIEAPLPELEEEIPKPIEPLRPVAERMIPSTRVSRPSEKAVKKERFITIDEFRQIRGDISITRGILKKASSFFSKLERIKGGEDRGYLELCNGLQDIQEKIMFINKVLFKE